MKILGTIREFKTKNFKITVEAIPEDVLDLSWDDDMSVLNGLKRGELVDFTVRATLYFRGVEMADNYLGECIYKDYADFMDHIGSKGRWGSYFVDMVKEVISQGKDQISDMKRIHIR